MTGIVTASIIPAIILGSDIRATPPSFLISDGTLSNAITEHAPASSAIFASSGVTTSMITPPFNICARPTLTFHVPVSDFAELSFLFPDFKAILKLLLITYISII